MMNFLTQTAPRSCLSCWQFELARRQMTELWAHHDSKAQEEKYALQACKYQSSCNLVKQAQARKAKKSLNIIHIGNICAFPLCLDALRLRPASAHARVCEADLVCWFGRLNSSIFSIYFVECTTFKPDWRWDMRGGSKGPCSAWRVLHVCFWVRGGNASSGSGGHG